MDSHTNSRCALRQLRLVALALACSIMTMMADAGDAIHPEPPAMPTEVILQIAILDVDGIDSSQQIFTANVFFSAQWHDPRLAGRYEQATSVPLTSIWNPELQIVNQQKLWLTLPERVTVYPDGLVTYTQRVWGNFSQPLNLRSFPLDQQLFEIRITVVEYVEGEIVFKAAQGADISGIADALSLSDWEILSHNVDFTPYHPYEGLEPSPSMALQFDARRLLGYYLMKILIPLLFIVGMSYLVFWIPVTESSTRISVSITAMLTLIAYRFMIGDLLPKVSYMTRLDTFIMLCTTLVFCSLIHAVLSGVVDGGHSERALKLDHRARWLFPLTLVAVAVYSYTLW